MREREREDKDGRKREGGKKEERKEKRKKKKEICYKPGLISIELF